MADPAIVCCTIAGFFIKFNTRYGVSILQFLDACAILVLQFFDSVEPPAGIHYLAPRDFRRRESTGSFF